VKVGFRDSFARDLKGVKDKALLKRVKEIIEAAAQVEALSELPNLKKLKGGGDYFRLRVGDYRVGLALEGSTLVFVRFLNRKDIYKYFP
jgi:mRNA interferase RelE/StbE